MNDRLIEKMKKLLAMSQDKSSEHEAMIAAKQLHALLSKHNISMSELEDKEEEVGQQFDVHSCRPWKRYVAHWVSALYFCSFYYMKIGRGKSQYVFVGKEHNRLFASHIFTMIVTTIERESRTESKKLYGREVSSFVNSFWSGAASRIVNRCDELIKAAKAGELEDEEGNTLPIMLNVYDSNSLLNSEWLESQNFNIREKKSKSLEATNSEGLRKGREAGNRVQLSRSLQSQSSTKLIGN